ncbi:MAG: hypothetical protein U0869_06535 [Chloroflexota bacterium]
MPASRPRPVARRRARLAAVLMGVVALAGLAGSGASFAAPALAASPPANDALADAVALPPGKLPLTKSATTAGATVQDGEPVGRCVDGNRRTVWYRFTPDFTGAIQLDTMGSRADTSLSAFSGSGLANLRELVCNASMGGKDPDLAKDARITVPVAVGVTYRIRVDSAAPGSFVLHAKKVLQPGNDTQALPFSLGSVPVSTTASNTKATLVDGEPLVGSCDRMSATRWFSLTPSKDQVLQADTFTSFLDTQLAVYKRTGPGQLKAVACSDDANGTPQSAATWIAEKGATYLLQIGGKLGQSGTIRLHVTAVSRPKNDDLAGATAIAPGTPAHGSTLRATPQGGETASCDPGEKLAASAWYRWDSGATGGPMRLSTGALSMAVYTGSGLASLAEVACGGGDLDFAAADHTVYRIRVWGRSGVSRPFTLKLVAR